MDALQRVTAITSKQHALVSLAQALGAGLTPSQVKTLVRTGHWQRRRRGVFAMAGAPQTVEQAVLAAILAAGEAFASHLTGARLRRLRAPEPDRIDLLTLDTRRLQLAGVRHHRTDTLPAADLTTVRGIPVTSAARTLSDISGMFSVHGLGRTVNDALRRGATSLRQLRACHERLAVGPGRRAHLAMAQVLAQRQPGFDPGDSERELWVVETLVGAGLPRPEQQHLVRVGNRRFYLDTAYPAVMGALEYDGWAAHGDHEAFHADRERWRLLTAAGWRIVHVTARTTERELIEAATALLGRQAA